MSRKGDHKGKPAEPTVETQEPSERRDFLRTAAVAALGASVLGVVGKGEAAAPPAAPAAAARTTFTFDANVSPAALTPENIKKITDKVAAALAQEAKSGLESAPAGFHIKVGGGHSRVFSKTADHKNVTHSEVIIEGSGP